MTAAPEKAAPIPAEVQASMLWTIQRFRTSMQPDELLRTMLTSPVVQDWLADREARPSLPDSREERIREDDRAEFNRGYLIAVANVMNMHKDAVIAVELLVQLGVTIDEAEGLDLTEYDMDALKRLRSEPRAAPFFKRKRRARARQGGNNG